MLKRRRFNIEKIRCNDGYDNYFEADGFIDSETGRFVSSQVDHSHAMHMPVLDVDDPVFRIVESKTPGHQHIYIDKPMSWRQYKKLMRVLVKLGIVDKDWWRMCKRRRFGSLVAEPDKDKGFWSYGEFFPAR